MTTTAPVSYGTPTTVDPADLVAAHLLTLRALELAGKRLLTRAVRGTYGGDVRRLHEHVPVTADQLPRLLAGAFDWVEDLAGLGLHIVPTALRHELTEYVGALLTTGTPHDAAHLAAVIRKSTR